MRQKLQDTHIRGKDIRILENENNKGIGESRNILIENAAGRYLFFMDADDLIEPNTIQLLYEKAVAFGAEAVYASYEKIDNVKDNVAVSYQYSYKEFAEDSDFAMFFFRQYGKFQTTVWNCLLDISVLRKSNVRFIDAVYWEDLAFAYDLATHIKRVVLLPDITYHYICRPNTLSSYHERNTILREEVLKNVSVVDYLKEKCLQLKGKCYLPYMCYNVVMNSFYIVIHVLKYYDIIIPTISYQELRCYMKYPLALKDILRFRKKWGRNLALWGITQLPNPLFVLVVKMIGKMVR